jgi:hypothetical protein
MTTSNSAVLALGDAIDGDNTLADASDSVRASHEAEAQRLRAWEDRLKDREAAVTRREIQVKSDAIAISQAQDEAEKALTTAANLQAALKQREADLVAIIQGEA